MNKAQESAIVESMNADRDAPPRRRLFVAPGLHHRRVQVQVVRHDRRAKDADRDVELFRVREDGDGRHEARRHRAQVRARDDDLEEEAPGDRRDQDHDQRLQQPKAPVLQQQHQEDVERRDRDPPGERYPKQQIQRDR
jgi:hypothetical protein